MNTRKKIGAIIILGLFAFAQGNAQMQYVNANIGVGLHSLQHAPEVGENKAGFGAAFNASYIYFFNEEWGIGSGFGISIYQSKTELTGLDKSLESDPTVADGHTDSCYLVTTYSGWVEKQKAVILDIPIGAYYKYPISTEMNLIAGAGAKIIIPVWNKYEVIDGTLSTKKEFPAENVIIENLPHHECGSDDERYSNELDTKVGFALFIDLGINYTLKNNMMLYGGIFTTIGLSNIIKKDDVKLMDTEGIYHGVFASDMVSKTAPLALGLKVGITLPMGNNK